MNKLNKQIKKALLISGMVTALAASTEESLNFRIITKEDIENTGLNNLADIINELVVSYGPIKNRFNTVRGESLNEELGDGSLNVNIKSLGADNIVVLLNGKRLGNGINDEFDFSILPISIIKQVDISTASSQYLSGGLTIINIKTKDAFNGIHANAYYGVSDRGDADSQNFNLAFGVESDRASVFFNADYVKSSPIWAGDREFSKDPIYGTGNNHYSRSTPQGRFIIYDADGNWNNVTTTPGSNGFNTANDPDLIRYNLNSSFNYAPDNYLLNPQERTSIYIQGRYQLTDNISIGSEALYNRRESAQFLAPSALVIGDWGGEYGDENTPIGIGGQNPYNPFGYDLTPGYSYSGGLWFLGRRMVELGHRKFQQTKDSFYYNLNLAGNNDSGWDWSIDYAINQNDQINVKDGLLNMNLVRSSLSNECIEDETCVPLNLFGGAGTITQEMMDYIAAITDDNFTKKSEVLNLELVNNKWNIATRDIELKLSYEYRNNQGSLVLDHQHPDLTPKLNHHQSYEGEYSVNTFKANTQISLLNNSSNQKLLLDLSMGYEKYSFTDGEIFAFAGLKYIPTDLIHFDLSYSKTNSPPQLIELFLDKSETIQLYEDPCNSNSYLPGCYRPISTPPYVPDRYAAIHNGGNASLDLENWESYNLKFLINPLSIDRLRLYASYYEHSTSNNISDLTVTEILTSCAYSGIVFCDRIIRPRSFVIDDIYVSKANHGNFISAGINWGINYSFDSDIGTVDIDWSNNYITELKYSKPNYETGLDTTYDQLDVGSEIKTETPDLYSNINISLSKKMWSLNYQFRYITGVEEKCNPMLNQYVAQAREHDESIPNDFIWCTYDSVDFNYNNRPGDLTEYHDRRHIGGSTYHDVNIKYSFPQYKSSVRFGVENLFDKSPPLSSNANANSYDSSIYNGVGRYYWLKISKEF